jgi:hypothetical protein
MTHDLDEEDQLVVYDGAGARLVVLNQVGAAIFFLVDGKRSVADIAAFLKDSIAGVPESCEAEVETFLDDLHAQGLLTYSEN